LRILEKNATEVRVEMLIEMGLGGWLKLSAWNADWIVGLTFKFEQIQKKIDLWQLFKSSSSGK